MATFGPYARNQVPGVTLDTRGPAAKMFRHKGPEPQGINVWLLTDGTAVETQPCATYNADGSLLLEGSARVSRFLNGGVAHTVSAAEAAVLTASGYGSLLS